MSKGNRVAHHDSGRKGTILRHESDLIVVLFDNTKTEEFVCWWKLTIIPSN